MPNTISKIHKLSEGLLAIAQKHVDFLGHAVATLYENESTADGIDGEYDTFTDKDESIGTEPWSPEAQDTFDYCFREWLFSNRSFEFHGKMLPASEIFLKVAFPYKPDAENRAYLNSLRNTVLGMYSVVDFDKTQRIITVRDVLNEKRLPVHARYSILLPDLEIGEVLGLRLIELHGETCVGYGIYRFMKKNVKKLVPALNRVIQKDHKKFSGKNRDVLYSTVVTDGIIKAWVQQLHLLYS